MVFEHHCRQKVQYFIDLHRARFFRQVFLKMKSFWLAGLLMKCTHLLPLGFIKVLLPLFKVYIGYNVSDILLSELSETQGAIKV